jgi:hypothetical protein
MTMTSMSQDLFGTFHHSGARVGACWLYSLYRRLFSVGVIGSACHSSHHDCWGDIRSSTGDGGGQRGVDGGCYGGVFDNQASVLTFFLSFFLVTRQVWERELKRRQRQLLVVLQILSFFFLFFFLSLVVSRHRRGQKTKTHPEVQQGSALVLA